MKKLLKNLGIMLIAFCLVSCGNTAGNGNGNENNGSGDVTNNTGNNNTGDNNSGNNDNSSISLNTIEEGEYVFVLKSSEEGSNDILVIDWKLKFGYNASEYAIMLNQENVYGSIQGESYSSGYDEHLTVSLNHQKLGKFDLTYKVDSGIIIKIGNRNFDYDFVSLTKNGVNVYVKNVSKSYKLAGTVKGYWLDDEGHENEIWGSREFQSGEKVILKYAKNSDQDFEEKYYLSLYDDQDTHKDFVRANDNVNVLAYTFTDKDVGRKFIMRATGIEEYKGSTLGGMFYNIEVVE